MWTICISLEYVGTVAASIVVDKSENFVALFGMHETLVTLEVFCVHAFFSPFLDEMHETLVILEAF